MNKAKIEIGNKVYNCQVAENEEDRRKGLMNVEYLAPDNGVLFVFDEEGTHEMWMKNTKIPLDLIAINEDEEVVMVYTALPESETLIPFPNSKYILEVNANSGIVEGDEFDIDDSDDLNKYIMKVLAPDGTTQFFLLGGERIFSRISTKKMIKNAKRANEKRNNKEAYEKACKKLGKIIFKELYAQDHRDPEYVQVPR